MELTDIFILILSTFVIANTIVDYFNYKQQIKLTQELLYLNNKVDSIERKAQQDLDNTCVRIRQLNSNLDGVKDTIKYDYMPNKTAYCMYDMHNARLISLNDSLEGYRNILARLEPLAPLADKFDVKRRMLYNKEYMADLKEELKEIEDELKGIA
jgi:hypothetical protein